MPCPLSAMARRIAGSVQGAFIWPQLRRHLDFTESARRPRGRPKLVDFLSRIHGRGAYRRALERGGPYSF
jgi:glutathione S-transferase